MTGHGHRPCYKHCTYCVSLGEGARLGLATQAKVAARTRSLPRTRCPGLLGHVVVTLGHGSAEGGASLQALCLAALWLSSEDGAQPLVLKTWHQGFRRT